MMKISLDQYGNVLEDGDWMVERAGQLKVYAAQLLAVAAKLEHTPYPLGTGLHCLDELDTIMHEVVKL